MSFVVAGVSALLSSLCYAEFAAGLALQGAAFRCVCAARCVARARALPPWRAPPAAHTRALLPGLCCKKHPRACVTAARVCLPCRAACLLSRAHSYISAVFGEYLAW
jgi:hypothetical protein